MPLTEQDHAVRRTGLSASDMVILASETGRSFGRSAHDVWMHKMLPGTEQVQNEAMEIGHDLEPKVLMRGARKRELALLYPSPTVRHPKLDWAVATPDAIVVAKPDIIGFVHGNVDADQVALAESKVVGINMAHYWRDDDEPPEHVLIQVTWQMFVKGLRRVYVFALIGTGFKTYVVEYDEELASALADFGGAWWDEHIVRGKPPVIDRSEGAARMVKQLAGSRANGKIVPATDAADRSARLYMKAKKDEQDAVERKREAQSLLTAAIGKNDGISGPGWQATNRLRKGYVVDAYEVKEGRKFDFR